MWKFKYFVILFLTVLVKLETASGFQDCPELDIRDIESFHLLENCTAIVGNLQIIMSFDHRSIQNLTFPNLREITGFLMIMDVANLHSLGDFFPNLIVIRGQNLFLNYALILYRMWNLTDIGLENFVEISRGSVRVDSCPMLCTDTVDWSAIIKHGNFVMKDRNTRSNDCLPRDIACHNCKNNYCWGPSKCQKAPDLFYKNFYCHFTCMRGGCFGTSDTECFACEMYNENGRCVEKCSDQTILNTDTLRCISQEECQRLKRKVYDDKCVMECPSGFSVEKDTDISLNGNLTENYICLKCQNRCPKICAVNDVLNSVAQLQRYEGCTVINGSLEIYILDDIPNINQELNKYLGDLEEIWGILKIHRSTPLTSLDFLSNLRLIQGNKNHNYSLLVYENQNLQKLFDWTKRDKPVIAYGNVQFHNNKMLCQKEVDDFQIYSMHKFTRHDLIESNGFHRFCINEKIQTKYEVWSSTSIGVMWKDYKISDVFPSYIIYFVNSTLTELQPNHFHERESCSAYSWKSIYIDRENLKFWDREYLIYNLTGLEPFTRYAFFIQTYIEDSNSTGIQNFRLGQSAVVFVRTKYVEPSRVINLDSSNKTNSSITLKWDVVGQEHEIITHFFVDIIAQPENLEKLDQRNYCEDPIRDHLQIENDWFYQEDDTVSLNCCDSCRSADLTDAALVGSELLKWRENREFDSEAFSKTIYDEVVMKKNLGEYYQKLRQESILKKPEMENYVDRRTISKDARTYTVDQLEAFTTYAFMFYACANDSSDPTNQKPVCSSYVMYTNRTAMNPDFDSIYTIGQQTDDGESYELNFNEPREKNGAIINYQIEHKYIDENDGKIEVECITRKQHEINRYLYVFVGLKPGMYALRVRAVSLAGPGAWTDELTFRIIEKEKPKPNYTPYIVTILVIFLVLLTISIVSFYYKYKIMKLFPKNDDHSLLVMNEEFQDGSMESLDDWTTENTGIPKKYPHRS